MLRMCGSTTFKSTRRTTLRLLARDTDKLTFVPHLWTADGRTDRRLGALNPPSPRGIITVSAAQSVDVAVGQSYVRPYGLSSQSTILPLTPQVLSYTSLPDPLVPLFAGHH